MLGAKKTKRLDDPRLLREIRKRPCLVCGQTGPNDASHIKSKGSGGPDTPWNVVSHCRDHHIVWHRLGWKRFVEKYPLFGLKLIGMGWVLDDQLLGLWHPDLLEGEE